MVVMATTLPTPTAAVLLLLMIASIVIATSPASAFQFYPLNFRRLPYSSGVDQRSHAVITTFPFSWYASGPSSSSSSSSLLILFAGNDNGGNNKEVTETESTSSSTCTEKTEVATAEAAVEVPDPPHLLSLGYNVAGLANVIAAVGLLFNVGKINYSHSASSLLSSSFATKSALSLSPSATSVSHIMATRYQPNLLATYIAGSLGYLLLAAGTCNILSDSVKSKRLYTSDTYKRLTIGLLLFGLLGMFSVPGESGCISTASMSSSSLLGGGGATANIILTLLANFITTIASFVGWEYSAGGFGLSSSSSSSRYRDRMKNIVQELLGGCKRVWKTLPVSDARPATFYRSFFIILTLGSLIFNAPELIFNLRQGVGLVSLPVSLTISSMSRLGLMSVILYVLKDAAERKRLDGSTFIKLNLMVGLWALGGE
jgi:hypothetical protein